MKTRSGYTLLELVAVLALLAIIFSISLPSIKGILISKERSELMTFRKDIIYARNRAIIENTYYTLNVNKTNNSYQIIKHSKKNETIRNVKFKNGIKILNNNFESSLSFSPTGTPNKGGTILLTNTNGDIIEITITPATGKVNIYFSRNR